MHEEHRKRVRERFLSEGLDSFAPHNVLELMLFYAIPRRDTNEIAHRLLDRFGSLRGVFDADIRSLTEVDGIGENAAVLIKLIPQIARRYMTEKSTERKRYNTARKVAEYFVPLYVGETNEVVYLLLLDASYHIIRLEKLFEGSVNSARITSRAVIEHAINSHASMVALAHNHPDGLAIPSTADVGTTNYLRNILETIDVRLLEHFVIAGERYTPILHSDLDMLRQCVDEEEIRRFYEE